VPKTAIITVGLQFGDEGKGATVDYLCRTRKVDLVVRYSGGSQCGHTVVTPDGKKHTFAQFGSGTLSGVPTYVGPMVIVNPPAFMREKYHLQELGVDAPHTMITFSPDCLITTVYHQLLNRTRETSRQERHGSCGHGIGETRHYWLKYGDDAITLDDLTNRRRLRNKLELLRKRTLLELQSCDADMTLPHVTTILSSLKMCEGWMPTGEMPVFDDTVFEGAQGVLLDEWHGFHPHTTWSTVTAYHAYEMCEHADQIYTLGVARVFTIRHGVGPHPTYDPNIRVKDENNPDNPWQGRIRFGHLDLPLLQYAADVCDIYGMLNGIAINGVDQVEYPAKVCHHYWDNHHPGAHACYDLQRQEKAGELLLRSVPIYEETHDLVQYVDRIYPVVIRGHGPSADDRSGIVEW
jgi:adenylosuccinate synthase